MKRLLSATLAIGLLGVFTLPVHADPEQDLEQFRSYFYNRFPDTPKDDFINGVYSIDPASREQWESMEEFPPYELNLDKGKELFNTPFNRITSYNVCYTKLLRQGHAY